MIRLFEVGQSRLNVLNTVLWLPSQEDAEEKSFDAGLFVSMLWRN